MYRTNVERTLGTMGDRFYRIRVSGILSDRFAATFDSMSLDREHGSTVLSGVCVDASALFGVLDRVRDLGLDLLEIQSYGVAPCAAVS